MTEPRDGVVLLHGLGRTSGSMRLLARRLTRAGYAADCPRYPSTKVDLAVIAELLEPKVRAFESTFSGQIHFVTHSLGGLALRTLFARFRPEKLGRVVMLAPPSWRQRVGRPAPSLETRRGDFGTKQQAPCH